MFRSSLRDGHLFLHHFPALRTGLLSLSPLGDESSAHTSKPYVDANGRCRIGYASIQICTRPSASPARTAALSVARFERNDVIIILGDGAHGVTWMRRGRARVRALRSPDTG
jgi:hypothetical protein